MSADVTGAKVSVEAHCYTPLVITLPEVVDDTLSRAKFNNTKKRLKLTLPRLREDAVFELNPD